MQEDPPAELRHPKVPDSCRLLNLQQLRDEFGLSVYAIYRAGQEGRLHALQHDDGTGRKGRKFYAEWEVRAITPQYHLVEAA
jgi:hypothetical protein